jgi:replicative DNA helicase
MRTVGVGDFDHGGHRLIFASMVACYSRHRDFDLANLVAELAGSLDRAGGRDGLERLVRQVPTAAGFGRYAREVKAASKMRALHDIAERAAALAGKPQPPDMAEDAIASVAESLVRLTRESGREPTTLAAAEAKVISELQTGRRAMMETGIERFDAIAGGVPRSGVWTILGYPAQGKTTFMLSALVHMATAGRTVRVCSFEQSSHRIAATLLAQASGVQVHQYLNRGGTIEPSALEELARVAERHAGLDFAVFEENLSPPQIFAECAAMRGEPGIVALDYIQDIPPFGPYTETTQRISEGMRIMASIARELGWLVVVVSQLGKSESRQNLRPKMTDGVGSGAIEQRSDLMTSVWRPHYHESPPPGDDALDRAPWRARVSRVQINVLKNKFGPLGEESLVFDGKAMRFRPEHPDERRYWSD